MNYKSFKGYENFYPERIDGTAEWFYSTTPSWVDADEVDEYNGKFSGTRLLIFNIDGTIIEPFTLTKNVYIESPVYSGKRNSFGLLRYDFNIRIIQMYEYFIEDKKLELITELPFKEGGDFVNLRIEKEPFMLVKSDVHDNEVKFVYPVKKEFKLENNETLFCVDGDTFITSKWIEDPDYREEIITRKIFDGLIVQREKGYIVEMPNGYIWKMTE